MNCTVKTYLKQALDVIALFDNFIDTSRIMNMSALMIAFIMAIKLIIASLRSWEFQ